MIKKTVLATLVIAGAYSQTFQEYQAKQQQESQQITKGFSQYKQTLLSSFKAYEQARLQAFSEYKNQLKKSWVNPKLSTKTQWLSYTPDQRTRTDVDFKHEKITIETIAHSKEEAEKKLKQALARVITVNNATVESTDPLQIKLSKIPKPKDSIQTKADTKPILSTVIFNKPVTPKRVNAYVQTHINNNINSQKSTKIKGAYIYSVSIRLPSDTMQKRSKLYYEDIKKYSSLEKISIPLVFAIMQTESSFNPRARSYVPAYGLMQIVPTTAGLDAYRYIYNQHRLVTGEYLYNSTNNIEMGSAYLHIVYYNYLKAIANPLSRLYCTIAAYNTGAGNVAWAFTRTTSVQKAAIKINAMTPAQVYETLLKNLKYAQTRNYLKTVSRRMVAYDKIY